MLSVITRPEPDTDCPIVALHSDWKKQYLVLHNHPDGLVMSQQQRDLIFATGNVIGVAECSTYSLQAEYFKTYLRRPLVIVLWGMEDRYGEAAEAGLTVLMAKTWSDVYHYCLEDQKLS